MDQNLFQGGPLHSEFYADFKEKYVFSKFAIFQVIIPLLNCELNFALFRKLRGQKKSKFRFFWSVFDTEKYGHEIFPKFELFGFFRN